MPNKSSTSKTGLGIVIIVIAWIVGFYAGREFHSGKSETVTAIADSSPLEKEISRLAGENRRLAAVSGHRRDDTVSVPNEQSSAVPLARVNLLRDLKKRQIVSIRIPVVYNDGRLSDGFAELFSLTSSEADALKRALADARTEIGRLSFANADVTQKGDSTVVTVKPFYGGADVYDRLMDAFEHTLGPERYSAMMDFHTDELPRMYSGFGAEQRAITITRDASSRFRIEDTRRTATGSVGRSTAFSDPSELSDFYRWLRPLLPPTRPSR